MDVELTDHLGYDHHASRGRRGEHAQRHESQDADH